MTTTPDTETVWTLVLEEHDRFAIPALRAYASAIAGREVERSREITAKADEMEEALLVPPGARLTNAEYASLAEVLARTDGRTVGRALMDLWVEEERVRA